MIYIYTYYHYATYMEFLFDADLNKSNQVMQLFSNKCETSDNDIRTQYYHFNL